MASTITTSSQSLNQIFSYSIQAVYTGAPDGTIKLQASNDNSNWVDVTSSSVALTSSGNGIWNVSGSNYQYVRVKYTDGGVGGTGALTVLVFIRGF